MKWNVYSKSTMNMPCVVVFLISISILLFFTTPLGHAGDWRWDTIGLRAGFGDSRNNESFSQYEAYATVSLPFHWEADDQWVVGSYVGINVGVVTCAGNSFIASVGPALVILTPSQRFAISIGIYPTYLDSAVFESDRFGTKIQFTSALNINFQPFRHITIGYRLQHMSNAGISDENPGLNTHLFEMGYRF